MHTVELQTLSLQEKMGWLQYAIAPRPIALVSSISKDGHTNLSPFSFFNLFSYDPPIVVFSPVIRARDNTVKHTLENIMEVPQVVINICDYAMVHQTSLSSTEYPKHIDEFVKSGFTKLHSMHVQPPRVKEAKVQMECAVIEIKSLGKNGGAGQLVIAEVLYMHVDKSILNAQGTMIDQTKLHHIARLGGNWYSVVNETNLFEVERPNRNLGIGIDALPESIRSSKVLTGNNLAQLANVQEMPFVQAGFEDEQLKNIIQYYSLNPDDMEKELHIYAKQLLDQNKVHEAWQVLLAGV